MSAITFDTHKFVKTLAAAGLPEIQAEAISSAVRDAQDGAEVASKNDLKEMESRFGADLKEVRTDLREVERGLRGDIKEMKLRFDGEMTLLKWMLGLIVAGTATLILKSFF